MPTGLLSTTVTKRKIWSEGLLTLRLDAVLPFEAGQFFNLALSDEQGWIRRSYSAASAPGEPLEFYLVRVAEGGLTPRLVELSEGDRIAIERKAHGFFCLRYVPDARTLWCIATGTGLAPYISILRTPEPFRRFGRIVVVHGVRDHRQLGYRDELSKHPRARAGQLVYLPLLSREDAPEPWLKGRITEALASGALEQRIGTPLDGSAHVMLCGNPNMVKDMIELLQARGLRRHRVRRPGHITTESYW